MVEAGMGGSHMMNMMMLSQGLGGTGTNQLALYNVLNRRNNPRYFKAKDAISFIDGQQVNDYAMVDMGREGMDIMAMMYGGLGGLGMSAGQMYPTLMYGMPTLADPDFGGQDFMNAQMQVSGAW
jgi:hypothetical protein